jgi:hypothetical protein
LKEPDMTTRNPQAGGRATIEDQVLSAYGSLAKRRGDLVSLVRLRHLLGAINRDELDRTLKVMARARVIQLDPDPCRGRLTQEDRAAAILIGREDMHFLSVVR